MMTPHRTAREIVWGAPHQSCMHKQIDEFRGWGGVLTAKSKYGKLTPQNSPHD